jgi:hypothetical protein
MMTQIERPERRTPEQWAALVKEYETSAQSQRGFCAERGIGQSSLRYWRRRLQGDRPDGGGISGTQLVPVRVCADKPSHAGSGLIVVVGNGVRIEINPEFDSATLERVLATLEAMA